MISRSTMQRAITITLLIANLCLLVIYVSGWTKSSAQNNKKTVIRPLSLVQEPIEINLELKGQPVNATKAVRAAEGIRTEEFDGDADWLKNLKFKIKNTSEKVIIYVVLDLTFPETATTGNPRVGLHQIRLGVSPELKSSGSELYLAPSASREISLETDYSEMKKLIESRIPVKNITNMVVRLETALFDDDTKWFAGTLYRRNLDPTNLQKWIPVDR